VQQCGPGTKWSPAGRRLLGGTKVTRTNVPSRRLLVAIGLVVAAWTALGAAVPAARDARTTADEPQYLMTAISLGEDHNLDVADERDYQRFRAFHRAELPQQEAERANGALVSPHDPLLPAILAAPMRLGGWVAAKLTLALLAGALAAALVWVATYRFGVGTRAAVITTLAFSTAAPLAVYGTQVYPEIAAALAVTIAIAAITGPLRARNLVVAAIAMVALPWLAVKYAPVVVALGLVLGYRLVRERRFAPLTVFAAVIAAAALLFAVAHEAWYGGITPYATGSHFTGGEFGVVGDTPNYLGRSVRLIGLLVDRDFGLAAWQPAYVFAVAAFAALLRARPPRWGVLALPILAGWLNATFVALTMSGWWFPGRQVVVVLPCAVLAVAWWVSQRPPRLTYVAVTGVLGASVFAWFVVQGVFAHLTFVVTFEAISCPVINAWRLLLPDYRDGGVVDWTLHVGWLVIVAVIAARAADVRFIPKRDARRSRAHRTTGVLVDA
jgi:hypothetical protein